MKKIFSKEMMIGLVTAISLVILYVGVNYLKGIKVFQPVNHYFVRMPNVNELQQSSPVYIDGFKIGVVNTIDFQFDNRNYIPVQVNLDKQMRIQTGSYFELKSGFTSGAYLELHLNKYVDTYYEIGDTIDGISAQGLMDRASNSIVPQIESILPRLDSILQGIQMIVNHPALVQSLEHISASTASLENSSKQLNQILSRDIRPMLTNLNQTSSDLAVFSGKVKQLDFDLTMNKVNSTLQNINQLSNQLNNKDNTLGLLLNDRLLYDRLDSAVSTTYLILSDFKINPKRYIHLSIF